ncbi:MAG: sterol desaturase family protein, partial [Nitrospira sp.]|nr:sterol desaturase family protein [Nitrospira sp.]
NWMHLNVTWNSAWLGRVFVTPRSHHIHHSRAPAHQMKNLGALLTIWDRLFGTYYDPDQIQRPLSFGLNEQVASARLMIGV